MGFLISRCPTTDDDEMDKQRMKTKRFDVYRNHSGRMALRHLPV